MNTGGVASRKSSFFSTIPTALRWIFVVSKIGEREVILRILTHLFPTHHLLVGSIVKYLMGMTIFTVKSCYLHSRLLFSCPRSPRWPFLHLLNPHFVLFAMHISNSSTIVLHCRQLQLHTIVNLSVLESSYYQQYTHPLLPSIQVPSLSSLLGFAPGLSSL